MILSNDIDNLNSSGLEMLMEDILAHEFDNINGQERVNHGRRFTLLGDGIFRFAGDGNSCIKSYHHSPNNVELQQWEINENHLFKSIRQHIEHSYGAVENTFALCADRRNFKLRGQRSIANELLDLSHFFYNCYSCDNGNSTSNRFGLIPPTLVEYLTNNI